MMHDLFTASTRHHYDIITNFIEPYKIWPICIYLKNLKDSFLSFQSNGLNRVKN